MKLGYRSTIWCLILLLIIPILIKCRPRDTQREWDISQGFVPDSATAVQIAQILFIRVYGEKILKKKPFIVTLKNRSIWVVEGSLDEGVDGGVPHIEIQKSDGKILNLCHYK